MSGLLLSDDLVKIAETGSALQILIGIIQKYSKRWLFEINVKKCTALVFSKTGKASGR